MAKLVAATMSLWLVVAIMGAMADGYIIIGGEQATLASDAADLSGVSQVRILSNPFEGASLNPLSWFAAGLNYLKSWANVLTWNFTIFEGAAQPIRWTLLTVLGIPLLAEFVTRLFGR